jgi:hypothetical protein
MVIPAPDTHGPAQISDIEPTMLLYKFAESLINQLALGPDIRVFEGFADQGFIEHDIGAHKPTPPMVYNFNPMGRHGQE